MSRRILRICWMDDEPDRLKGSARDGLQNPESLKGRRADLKVVDLGGKADITAILAELDEDKKEGRSPHLIVIDQMLQKAESFLQRGSSLAAMIRDKDTGAALVGVTAADPIEVGALQREQFIEFFSRDDISTAERIPDLYAIADGFAALSAFKDSSGTSSTIAEDLCKLVKCPPADKELFVSILPGVFKATWDNGTRHSFARWIWHELLGRPGLLYDELEAATLLGLKAEGFEKLKSRLTACEYGGAFASVSRPRWWVSRLRERVRKLTGGTVADPLSSLGRKLIDDQSLFSKCHGRPHAAEVPTVVAYSDGTKRKRIQARIEDTAPLETDTPPLGFEQRRIYNPAEK